MLGKWTNLLSKLQEKLKQLSLFKYRYKVILNKYENIKDFDKIAYLKQVNDEYIFYTNKLKKSIINIDALIIDRYKELINKIFKTNILSSCSILFILLLFLLSNITIREVSFSSEGSYNYSVYKDVTKYIKRIGPFYFIEENLNDISNELRSKYYNYAYIGVRREGSKIYIDIEKLEDFDKNSSENNEPCDLVSSVDGKVVGLEIKKGITTVAINQIIKQGELLISGNLNYNQNAFSKDNLVSADGIVLIEYAYYKKITVPKEKEYLSNNLRKEEDYEIKIFNKEITKNKIYNDSFLIKNNIVNINKLIEINKNINYIKEYKKVVLSVDDALDVVVAQIHQDFILEKVSEKEEIKFIKLVNKEQNNDSYTFCFLIKQVKNCAVRKYYEE